MSPLPHWVIIAFAAGAPASAEERPSASDSESRRRPVSPRVAEMLASAVPKYLTPQPSAVASSVTASTIDVDGASAVPPIEKPRNGIVRLPDYVVRESKEKRLPKYEEVLVPRELEKLAMNEFIGAENGFDRGFLNLITIPALWEKIPILGRIPMAGPWETNEQRAMRLYRDDRGRKMKEELESLMSPSLNPKSTKDSK